MHAFLPDDNNNDTNFSFKCQAFDLIEIMADNTLFA